MQSSIEKFEELFCNFGNQTVNRGNFELRISYEDDSSFFDPRQNDNNGIMVCCHRRYNLGDNDTAAEFESVLDSILDKHEVDYSHLERFETSEVLARKVNLLPAQALDTIVLLPLYLYDHSGITISCSPFSCGFDSGQVGWIYTTPEQLKALGHDVSEFGSLEMHKQIKRWLRSEVESYDSYLKGEVYSYSIHKDDECLVSCTGFLGDHDKSGLFAELKSAFEWEVSKEHEQQRSRKQKYLAKVKALIRNHTSLQTRRIQLDTLRKDAFAPQFNY